MKYNFKAIMTMRKKDDLAYLNEILEDIKKMMNNSDLEYMNHKLKYSSKGLYLGLRIVFSQ